MGAAPLYFHCPMARRNPVWDGTYRPDRRGRLRHNYVTPRTGHTVTRTGRTKPNPSRRRGSRVLGEAHEYRCQCGHVGWTTHFDILNRPAAA